MYVFDCIHTLRSCVYLCAYALRLCGGYLCLHTCTCACMYLVVKTRFARLFVYTFVHTRSWRMSTRRPGLPLCGFFVEVLPGSKVPLKVRKTAKGKKVTILSNISGDRSKAVTTLKHMLGVGGDLCLDDKNSIELQGDQTLRIVPILKQMGAMTSEEKDVVTAPMRKTVASWEPKVLLPLSSQPTSQACKLVHGNYWPYCLGNCSYCPPLTDVFEGLDIFCDWYEYIEKPVVVSVSGRMSDTELDEAMDLLGLKATVGYALKRYYEEKAQRHVVRQVVSNVVHPHAERVLPVVAPVGKPVVRAKFQPDRPVKVFLNQLNSLEECEYFVLEISLKDPIGWMSDYQEFTLSLLEGVVEYEHQELEDSRCLKIFLICVESVEMCRETLEDLMPGMFSFASKSPTIHVDPVDHVDSEVPVDHVDAPVDLFYFQRLAADLGVDLKIEFWEIFTQLIEESAGTPAAIQAAFSEAVLKVTVAEGFYDLHDQADDQANHPLHNQANNSPVRFSCLPDYASLGIPPPP